MKRCDLPQEVQEWIDIVEQEKYKCCEEQHLLVEHVQKCFAEEDIYIDQEQLSNYMKICRTYIPFDLFPWQKFVIALHDCC